MTSSEVPVRPCRTLVRAPVATRGGRVVFLYAGVYARTSEASIVFHFGAASYSILSRTPPISISEKSGPPSRVSRRATARDGARQAPRSGCYNPGVAILILETEQAGPACPGAPA